MRYRTKITISKDTLEVVTSILNILGCGSAAKQVEALDLSNGHSAVTLSFKPSLKTATKAAWQLRRIQPQIEAVKAAVIETAQQPQLKAAAVLSAAADLVSKLDVPALKEIGEGLADSITMESETKHKGVLERVKTSLKKAM